MSRQATVWRRVALASAAMIFGGLIGLVVAEVGLRMFWPGGDRYHLWPPHLTATFHPSPDIVHGVRAEAHVRVNSQGIRGDEWGANRAAEYRIVAIGGSTTECTLLDQSKTWPALLQDALGTTADGRKVWVGNLGRGGLNCRDHLGLMRLGIGQYDIDAIVMLVGANDMLGLLMEGDRYDPHFIDDEERYYEWLRSRFVGVPFTAQTRGKPLYTRTAMWQLARWVKSLYFRRHEIAMDSSGHWLAVVRENRRNATFVDELPPLDLGLNEFERLVTLIVDEARRRSLRIVFLTQPAIWKESLSREEESVVWMGWGAGGALVADATLPWWKTRAPTMYTSNALMRAMAKYNERLLETCARLGVECVDMAARIPRTLEMYYDDLHYTDTGSEKFASELAAYFKTREPFINGTTPQR